MFVMNQTKKSLLKIRLEKAFEYQGYKTPAEIYRIKKTDQIQNNITIFGKNLHKILLRIRLRKVF